MPLRALKPRQQLQQQQQQQQPQKAEQLKAQMQPHSSRLSSLSTRVSKLLRAGRHHRHRRHQDLQLLQQLPPRLRGRVRVPRGQAALVRDRPVRPDAAPPQDRLLLHDRLPLSLWLLLLFGLVCQLSAQSRQVYEYLILFW